MQKTLGKSWHILEACLEAARNHMARVPMLRGSNELKRLPRTKKFCSLSPPVLHTASKQGSMT